MILSPEKLNNIGVVILAAGKGTRLNCVDKPKVMCEIGGKPIVSYIVKVLNEVGFSKKQIMLVVGFKGEQVKEYFGDSVSYALQSVQLGTAHAALTGIKELEKKIKHVLVLGGDDSAFYTKKTLLDFIDKHIKNNSKLSLLSADVSAPSSLGRVVRHNSGEVEIIEKEYLTEEQKKIKEISTGTFCFDRAWYESIYPKMPKLRKLGEYGLPTALAMARDQNKKYQIIKIKDNNEWFGINTDEELIEANNRLN